MDLFKKCSSIEAVKKSKEMGVYPYFHKLETKQAPEVKMEGKEIIMIGSNNYLGLTSHPEVIEASIKATEKYGSGCSGSRFLNGTLDIHLALEKELANLYILASSQELAIICIPIGIWFLSNPIGILNPGIPAILTGITKTSSINDLDGSSIGSVKS